MVAAFIVARHGPVSRSAARSRMAARSSKDSARQAGAACLAAAIASRASCSVALAKVPSTARWLCGWTTSTGAPALTRCSPPMVVVSSVGCLVSSPSAVCTAARSGLPGA